LGAFVGGGAAADVGVWSGARAWTDGAAFDGACGLGSIGRAAKAEVISAFDDIALSWLRFAGGFRTSTARVPVRTSQTAIHVLLRHLVGARKLRTKDGLQLARESSGEAGSGWIDSIDVESSSSGTSTSSGEVESTSAI
jgi:hypothetical protein